VGVVDEVDDPMWSAGNGMGKEAAIHTCGHVWTHTHTHTHTHGYVTRMHPRFVFGAGCGAVVPYLEETTVAVSGFSPVCGVTGGIHCDFELWLS
jgi:hypothetical protein